MDRSRVLKVNLKKIKEIIKAAQLPYGGGPCGDVAIAINRIIFDGKAAIKAIFNEELAQRGLFVGHVVVEDDHKHWWDGSGLVNKKEIKQQGRWDNDQVFGEFLAYRYEDDDPELDVLFKNGKFDITNKQLRKNVIKIATEKQIRGWLGRWGLSNMQKELARKKLEIL